MTPFDTPSLLADLHSPEAPTADGAIVVTGSADDLLIDLFATFVFPN